MHVRFLHAICRAHVQHSKTWWLGATLSTAIPVIYSFSGGMRASIMTDATQVSHLLAHSSDASLLASLLAEVCVSEEQINMTACQRQTSASFQIAYHKGCSMVSSQNMLWGLTIRDSMCWKTPSCCCS